MGRLVYVGVYVDWGGLKYRWAPCWVRHNDFEVDADAFLLLVAWVAVGSHDVILGLRGYLRRSWWCRDGEIGGFDGLEGCFYILGCREMTGDSQYFYVVTGPEKQVYLIESCQFEVMISTLVLLWRCLRASVRVS